MKYEGIEDHEDDPYKFVKLSTNNTLHLDTTKTKDSVIKVPPARAKYLVDNGLAVFCQGPEIDAPPVDDSDGKKKK